MHILKILHLIKTEVYISVALFIASAVVGAFLLNNNIPIEDIGEVSFKIIFLNNTKVICLMFFFGLTTLGTYSILALITHGLFIGAVCKNSVVSGLTIQEVLLLTASHGILEICSLIIVCALVLFIIKCAFGFLIKKEAVKKMKILDGFKIFILAEVIILIAAVVEIQLSYDIYNYLK